MAAWYRGKQALFALGALVIPVAAGCEGTSTNTIRADTAPTAQATRVAVVKPARATMRRTVEEPGQITAFETTSIHAKTSGYLKNVAVHIGPKGKSGDALAQRWVPRPQPDP